MRKFVLSLMVLFVAIGLLLVGSQPPTMAPAPAAAQAKPTVLKIQASFPAGSLIYTSVLPVFAERVEKASGGRLKIEHLPQAPSSPRSRWWTPLTAGS